MYPVANPTPVSAGITFQDGNPPTVSYESLNSQTQEPMNLVTKTEHPQVEGQAMDTSGLAMGNLNPGTQLKISQVQSLVADSQPLSQCPTPTPTLGSPLRELLPKD